MEIILLSGNSIKNKVWIEEVEKQFKDSFETHIQYYKHWTEGKQVADFEYEVGQLGKYLEDKKDFILFGKSVGSMIIVETVRRFNLNPKLCILLGVPLRWARENNMGSDGSLKGFNKKMVFIQNDKDPYCSSDELSDILKELNVKNYKIVVFEGDTHDYLKYDEIKDILKREI